MIEKFVVMRGINSLANLKLNHDMNDEKKPNKPEDSSVNSVEFSELLAREISEDLLEIYGFACVDHYGESPYMSWERDGVNIWSFSKHWVLDAADQAGQDVRLKTMGDLAFVWKAFKLPSFLS